MVQKSRKRKRSRFLLLGERFTALLVLANLGFVVFDHTYIKARNWYLEADLYLQEFIVSPEEQYIQKVDSLQQVLTEEGIQSPTAQNLLLELQQLSGEIFLTNPSFRVKDRASILAQIQQLFVDRTDPEATISQALTTFWSEEYLERQGWENELDFFNARIRYLMLFYEPLLPYDIIKGIEPYRDSQEYLITVLLLEKELEKEGLSGENVETLLADLRDRSTDFIDSEYFFQLVNKTSTLTQIKYKVKNHIYERDQETALDLTPTLNFLKSINLLERIAPEVLWADKSSKEAFNTYWSLPNFALHGWQEELDYFDAEVRFLMQSFYFRNIGFGGDFVDRFWLVDLPWMALFYLEFLLRTLWLSFRTSLSWWGAMKYRWYDVFLLQPWLPILRVITAIIRLNQVKMLDLEPFKRYLGLSFLASFGMEVTQVVISRGIDQLQNTVGKGLIKKALFDRKQQQKESNLGLEDENTTIAGIVNEIWQLTTSQVLPEVRTDLERFLDYQVEKALDKSTIYRRIQRIPFVRRFPKDIANNIVNQISGAIASGPETAETGPPDPQANALKERLVNHFTTELISKLEQEETVDDLEFLLIDWLEEIKIKYLKQPDAAILVASEEEIPKQILPAKD